MAQGFCWWRVGGFDPGHTREWLSTGDLFELRLRSIRRGAISPLFLKEPGFETGHNASETRNNTQNKKPASKQNRRKEITLPSLGSYGNSTCCS